MSIRWRALRGALLLVGGLLFGLPVVAYGQEEARVRVEENFRREPNGLVLARVRPGATFRVLDTRGDWTQVDLRGWVWLPSLQMSQDPDLELVVAASGGENLRAEPSGQILARLVDGALLAELGREPSWAQVSRVGWIWTPSLDAPAAVSVDEPVDPGVGQTVPAAEVIPPGADPPARVPGGFIGATGGAILAAPDGDTLAVARPSGDLEVVRREGNWARVRLEGWMWVPGAAGDSPPGPEEAEPVPIAPQDLSAEPEAQAGRVVQWSLQFISLERAEEVRTDFFRGEPFLLTRFGGSDGPFVYVAVPPDRMVEVEGLVPLERIEVTGRIRTPASALTGVPIIDLVTLERLRGPA